MIRGDWSLFFSGWTVIRTVWIQGNYLNEILSHTSVDDNLLEIGAGSALSSVALFHSGRKNVIASDINDHVLARINRELPCLRTEKIDMFRINRPDHSVDCIFHQGLMEHFCDEQIVLSLREQGRVAHQIIFDVPNDRRWKKIQEFGDERFLSVEKWVKLIEDAGLRVVRITGRRLPKVFDFLPHRWQSAEFVKRTFGTSSIFVCKPNYGGRVCSKTI